MLPKRQKRLLDRYKKKGEKGFVVVRSRETKWIAPPGGGYNAEGPAKRGDPPTNPASASPPNQRIVLICGRGWGKQMALEQWEALWREMFDEENET